VLTVKSGLDPHMINELKDGFNIAFQLFLWPCWVPTISVLNLAYTVQRRVTEWSTSSTTRSSEDAINQSDACGRWRWSRVFIVIVVRVKTVVSTLVSVIKVNKPFLYVLSNVLWYYTHKSIICVKLWSGHTYEMHSVFFGKNGCDTRLAGPRPRRPRAWTCRVEVCCGAGASFCCWWLLNCDRYCWLLMAP
jgi:hypothetical protein